MAEGTDKATKVVENLKVFISYSRRDALGFAKQLAHALNVLGHEPSIDLQGISGAEEWQPRLREMIVEADTVVFVMSPESAASPVCAWEVEEAHKLGKRIVPVMPQPLGAASPPERIQRLNYIHFYEEPSVPESGFGSGIAKLDAALKADLDWLREHRTLLTQAEAWLARNRDADRLLRGGPLAAAERWAASRPTTAPDLTDSQRAYLAASRAFADEAASSREREVAERERLAHEAIGAAQRAETEAARARAAAEERDTARAEALAQARRRIRITIAALVGAICLAAVASILGWSAHQQALRAETAVADAVRRSNSLVLAMREAISDPTSVGEMIDFLIAYEGLNDQSPIGAPFSAGENTKSVFVENILPHIYSLVLHTYPNAAESPFACQMALISLTYNRGTSVAGDRRREMRNIQAALENRDFDAVPNEIRLMKRIWAGDPRAGGIMNRRDIEAAACEKALHTRRKLAETNPEHSVK